MKFLNILGATATVALGWLGGATTATADNIKIAYIDPLSGSFANVGDVGLKHFTYTADQINARGGAAGMKIEIVPFDNKINPKESLIQLQKAIDQGIRYITQGNGSSVASALIDAVNKYNSRNPGDEVVFLNYAAVDPAFTNDRCSFWHFRFDADADMKMAALTDWLARQKDIKKSYIIGQDYSFGKAVANAAVSMINVKRPDMEIVGNELHPLGKVKDFTPYIQKITASGAQVVITGNWGQDMALLIKSAADAGQSIPYLTYYGGGLGTPAAMGKAGLGVVKQVSEFNSNIPTTPEQRAVMNDFEQKYGVDYYYLRVFTMMGMFEKAVNEVGSADPVKVARALEGMTYETPYGEVSMRADNHQLLQNLYISTFLDGVKYGVEGLPYGFKTDTDGEIPAADTRMATTCEMKRPG